MELERDGFSLFFSLACLCHCDWKVRQAGLGGSRNQNKEQPWNKGVLRRKNTLCRRTIDMETTGGKSGPWRDPAKPAPPLASYPSRLAAVYLAPGNLFFRSYLGCVFLSFPWATANSQEISREPAIPHRFL